VTRLGGEGLGPIKPLARASAPAFEREQKRRELERRKEEAAPEKELRRDQAIAQAIATAERSLEQGKREQKIEKDRARLQAENARWGKQKEKLEAALRRAGD
jgi:colicin import membrane protein